VKLKRPAPLAPGVFYLESSFRTQYLASLESRLVYLEYMFNKTFYKFLFSFIAVVAGVLLFILILGTASPS
jgi:hypothetical protein